MDNYFRVTVDNLKLRAGSSKHNSSGILYPATKYYIHKSFDSMTLDHDIAIIEVKPFFAIGSKLIQEVKLPEIGHIPPVGSELIVSGWGVLDVSL